VTYTKELEIDPSKEGWGGDIRLSLVSMAETDTSKLYTAMSTYHDKKLGLLISFPKPKAGNPGFVNELTFKSIGPESDYLIQVLEKLYKQKPSLNLKFTNSIAMTYVDLGDYGKSLGAQDGGGYETYNQYKLFYEGEEEEDYAELYLNINASERWIELKEKDEEYRPTIIKVLAKK
jgi:hypothetical protein